MFRWLALVGLVILVAYGFLYSRGQAGYAPPRGIILEGTSEGRAGALKKAPQQHNLWIPRVWKKSGYEIRGVAEFGLTGRVLLKAQFSNDRESDLAPVDLTFGWGPMGDETFLKRVTLNHPGRFYQWQCPDAADTDKISLNSANMHMVPGSKEVEKDLLSIRQGEVISLTGYLINAQASDGWSWSTSTSRDDTGAGACEVVWVDKISH